MSQQLQREPGAAMKGYWFHLGDYYRDTVNLSMLEHGAYRRLLDHYYATEQPLDSCAVATLKRSAGPPSQRAIDRVLSTYFHLDLQDGTWHHKRCDDYIASYTANQPAREQRTANEKARRKRFNDSRRALFVALDKVGCTMPWNTPMRQLRAVAAKLGLQRDVEASMQPSEVLAQANTGNGSGNDLFPKTMNHKPYAHAAMPSEVDGGVQAADAAAARVCDAVGALGIRFANPADSALIALLRDGAQQADFETAAAEAASRGKGWAYVLGTVRGRRQDAQQGPKSGPGGANGDWWARFHAAGSDRASEADSGPDPELAP